MRTDPDLFEEPDECGICGENHDDTVCEAEECRVCGECPDNCNCEGPDDRFLVGEELKWHRLRKWEAADKSFLD